MTKDDVISNAVAQDASEEEILMLENTPDSDFEKGEGDDIVKKEPEPEQPVEKIVKKTAKEKSDEQKNRERHFNNGTLQVENPIESFYIKPSFFGEDKKQGLVNAPSEKEATKALNKKLMGIGLKVEETGVGNFLAFYDFDGNKVSEDLGIGAMSELTGNNLSTQDKADFVNGIIEDWVFDKEQEDENFDFNTYTESYQIAQNTPTQPDTEFPFVAFENLDLDEQVLHTYRVRNAIFDKFWKSDKGKQVKVDIEAELKIANEDIVKTIFENADMTKKDFWYLATIEYDKMLKGAQEEILLNNSDYQTVAQSTDDVLFSLFTKEMQKTSVNESREREFGKFVANNKVLSGIFKGALNYKMSSAAMVAGINTDYYKTEVKILDQITSMNDDEIYKIPFGDMRGLQSWMMPEGLEIKGDIKGYRVGDLKSVLKGRIQFHQVKALNAFLESEEHKETLASITSPDSQLWKDGRLNVTGDNWKEAVGEQGFNMLVNILGGGFPTFVMEAGGAYNEMLEGSAMAWAKSKGKDWGSLSVDDKMKIYFEVLDQGKVDFGSAKNVGVVSMFLENLSNYVFVTKGLKPLAKELGEAWTLMTIGKYRHAINLTGQAVKSTGIEMGQVTGVETFTEALQDGFSQYKVSSALGDPSYSWDQGMNTALTTILTAPIIMGGGKSVSTFTTHIISQVTNLSTSEQMRSALKNNRTQILKDFADGKFGKGKAAEKTRDERLFIADAVDTGLLKEDRIVEDAQAIENIINLEIEVQKKLESHRKLQVRKKELKEQLGDGYTEEMQDATNSEIELLAEEAFALKLQQDKYRHLDNYRVKQVVMAEEFNTGKILDAQGNPFNEKWDLSIVTDNKDIEPILNSLGIQLPRNKDGSINKKALEAEFKPFLEGKANEMVLSPEYIQKFNPNYDGKGIVLISDENVEANIMDDDSFASEVVVHSIEHVKFAENYSSEEGTAKLKSLQEEMDSRVTASNDGVISEMKGYVDARMAQYENVAKLKKGDRAWLEEYFNAWSDVSRALSLTTGISKDAKKTILEIGEGLKETLNPTEKKNFWDFKNTLDFFDGMSPGKETKFESYLAENGKDVIVKPVLFSLKDEVSSKGDSRRDMKLIDDTNPYSLNRPPLVIAKRNKDIGELIKKHQNFIHEDKNLQEKVRTEGVRKYQQELIYNNWGAFKKLVNETYKRDHELHSDLNEEFFIGEAMEQFVNATMTYDPSVSDAFGAYYFGEGGARNPATGAPILHPITKKPMSIAEARVAKIWQDMKTEFTKDLEAAKYVPADTNLDVHQILKDYNERSVLRESWPGMEENTVAYDNWVTEQTKIMSSPNFDWVNFMLDDDALSKIDKKGKQFYKLLKKSFKDKTYKDYSHTQEYIDYITNNAELLYNQFDQKTMNKAYPEFTEVDPNADVSPKTGRLTVPGSQKKKQKEVKSDTAGNIPRKKIKWNDEVEAAFIERLLRLDEIAKLKNQGLTPKEINKILRIDMLQQSTFEHMSKTLFRDAMMQVVTTDKFKAENGIDNSEIARMALLVDKGVDAKFSLRGKIKMLSGSHSFEQVMQWAGQIQRVVKPEWKADTEWEKIAGIINSDLFNHIPQDVKDFISSQYEQDHVEFAEEANFTNEMKNMDFIDQKVRDEASKNIRKDKEGRDAMIANTEILINALNEADPELLPAYLKLTNNNLELFGFHLRGLDAAKEKASTGLPGERYEDHKRLLELVLEGSEEGDGSRIYNKDVPLSRGGVFAKLIKILKQPISKKEKIALIEKGGLLEEIKNANKANINNLKTVVKVIADKIQKGEVDEAAIIQMFKMQSGLVAGFRGWSRLDGYMAVDGAQNINWKGEHAASMSKVDTEILELIYKYKKDSSVDLDAELDIILAGYGQILGDNTHMDELDDYGKTNVSDTYRFNMWDYKTANQYVNILGGDVKDMQNRILLERERKIQIYETKKKAKADENIRLKNTKKGKIKGVTIMDLDGTMVIGGKNIVYATHPTTGDKINIPSDDFTNVVEDLTKQGYEFDFSDYINVKGGTPSVLIQKIKNQISKYGNKDVHILTARQPEAAIAIQAWLKQHGVDLPIENITGLGVGGVTVKGEHKANWIEENFILNGYNDIYFVDDSKDMVDAVRAKFDEYKGVLVKGGKAEIVAASKVKTNNKALFMIGGPGSGKSTVINKAKFGENYTILNPDEKMEADLKAAGLSLDRSIYEKGSPELSQWAKIQAAAIKQFKEDIVKAREAGIGVVIDATGASPAVMQAYYDAFAKAGYDIGAIGVQTSVETSLYRNTERERVLPDSVVIDTWNKVQGNIKLYKEMFGDNFFQVFTDNMTMNDPLPSDFVRGVSNFTLKNPIIRYSLKGKLDLSQTFNNILETSTGIKSYKVFSEAESKLRGQKVGSIWDMAYPASAYDLEMFTYRYITKGTEGENQKAFFKEKLFDPFAKATNEINERRQKINSDRSALYKKHKDVKKGLGTLIEGTNFSKEQAVRVWLWNKNGIEVPGLSDTAKKVLLDVVAQDESLLAFADDLSIVSQQKDGYVAPTEYWTVENIDYDLQQIVNEGGRSTFLVEWKENVNQIFSKENKNKLRAQFGDKHVEALEDMLYRMEFGRNKQKPGRIEQEWNKWVNNSVGAIMFFNMRSAVLQTISATNYIDYGDNNILQAGKRFANQPQFWKDFSTIFNSDYLKQRRAGNQRGINEAELSRYVSGKTNKAKATVAFLLEKGFLPTQIADSFAISTGGATFYRSKVLTYEKQGLSTQEAEAQAWLDFQERTEKNQQSSRADLISQQQAGGLGRVLLAFGNTPMQYNRIMIKAALDLKNNRGKSIEKIGQIAYYGAVQNAIFTTLQTAVFAAFGEDDDELWDSKTKRAKNQMVDSLLVGMGFTGVIAKTVKNSYLQWNTQRKKGHNADHARTILEFANMSPTIGSKLRKLYSATQTEKYNQDVIDEMGFDINSPAVNVMANVISATTNIPTDRAVQKVQNILLASKSETEVKDKIALVLGWNPWDLDIETEARKIREEVKGKAGKRKKQENIIKKEKELQPTIEKEKEQEEKGTKTIFNCGAIRTDGTRCSNSVTKAGAKCTVHQEVKQRPSGKETKCKAKRTNGKPCNMMTTATSGFCVYHD